MLKLELVNVVKRFVNEGEAVIRGLSTSVAEGQMLVLLGPSGCGKTTTLQLVAGLLHPDDGSIVIDGKAVAGPGCGLPPERRNLGMVFQSYAVWPHKTVFENVAYGLELRSVPREELRRKVQQALDLVHLGELGTRYPSEISGGQQQRVALARAIVVEPSLLLLDEPLSNLDATLREQMRIELKVLQRKLGLVDLCHARSSRSDGACRSPGRDEEWDHRAAGSGRSGLPPPSVRIHCSLSRCHESPERARDRDGSEWRSGRDRRVGDAFGFPRR